jgi:hypothetical protein
LTSYDFWLFLHISFAVLWIGGGAMMQFFALRALASASSS